MTAKAKSSAFHFSAMDALLVFVPAAIIAHLMHASGTLIFILACLGILPLSARMAHSTEDLAAYLGPGIGGLLNATFGNAAELIIAFFAVKAGLLEVVKASITGSILGNILLVLGAAFLAGGLKNGVQKFNREAAGLQSSLLLLAVLALLIPETFVQASIGGNIHPEAVVNPQTKALSLGVAATLMTIYIIATIYSLRKHTNVFRAEEVHSPAMSKMGALVVLTLATVFVAFLAEMLVHSIEDITQQFGFSEMFIGLILVPIIGNAAEHSSAIILAYKNKVDVALSIAIGSSTQIALFVAPLLVFLSFLVGHPLTFIFIGVEVWAIAASVLVVNGISHDGESNWIEGMLLLGAYLILAMTVFFITLT